LHEKDRASSVTPGLDVQKCLRDFAYSRCLTREGQRSTFPPASGTYSNLGGERGILAKKTNSLKNQ
jgi:hypothetical protein